MVEFRYMDENISKRLEALEKKIDAIYKSVEKTRKYFLWTLIASLVFFLLPLIGIVLIIPKIIESFSGIYNF